MRANSERSTHYLVYRLHANIQVHREFETFLAEDPSAWGPIKARLHLKDDAALVVYRQRYLEGVPKRTVAEQAADARVLYRRLAEVGGEALVGKAKELDAGLFYDPLARE